MTTCKPGNYTISATVTMPAQTARQLGAPEKARYSGASATRTFGPVEIRVQRPEKGTVSGVLGDVPRRPVTKAGSPPASLSWCHRSQPEGLFAHQ